eukprot:6386449-Amphidinium_carterae.1
MAQADIKDDAGAVRIYPEPLQYSMAIPTSNKEKWVTTERNKLQIPTTRLAVCYPLCRCPLLLLDVLKFSWASGRSALQREANSLSGPNGQGRDCPYTKRPQAQPLCTNW